ncbi:hypothetical protein HWV62_42787 [Athelia sp. TMB]|nr:hypothetical protein HWV62_42787 [Athelia sp. TMB]
MESEEQQEIVWARFCALYLPAAVNRFINPPAIPSTNPQDIAKFKLFSPCSEMLVQTQHNAYFSKFLRSRSPIAADGKLLPKVVAERITELGQAWEPTMRQNTDRELENHYRGILTSAVQLLSTLQTAFVKERDQESVVPKSLRDELKPLLRAWATRYQGDVMSDVAGRVLSAWSPELGGGSGFRNDARRIRKHTLGWDVCGLPHCETTTELKACSRSVKFPFTYLKISSSREQPNLDVKLFAM